MGIICLDADLKVRLSSTWALSLDISNWLSLASKVQFRIEREACFVCLSSSDENPKERGSYQGCYWTLPNFSGVTPAQLVHVAFPADGRYQPVRAVSVKPPSSFKNSKATVAPGVGHSSIVSSV